MIEKSKLIDILNKGTWNEDLVCGFKKTITSRPKSPNLVTRIINFEFDELNERNIYDSLIIGSNHRFPIKTKFDMIEYIDFIDNYYILTERDPGDFNDIFKSQYIEDKQLNESVFYEFTGFTPISKIWVLYEDLGLIEVFMIHENNSCTFMSWELND